MTDIQDISVALSALPARFHLDPGPDPGPGPGGNTLGVLADLVADRHQVRNWIEADTPRVGAPGTQVGASMLVQHAAMVVGGSTMAAALLHGALPVADLDGVTVRPGSGAGPRATRWRFSVAPRWIEHGSPPELLARWAEVWHDGVLGALVDAVHSTVRVGRRMLVDNVASAASANLVFLDWWAPAAQLGDLAPHLARLGSPPIGETVTFSTIEHGDRSGLRSARRSCCLHFRCDPAHWCPTCPKLAEAEREQIMRTHLGHLDAVVAGSR